MSNEGFGGRLICGKPFSEAGVADALKDCPEHYPDGSLAIFDFITNGGDGKHDPDGWPTFKDWPAHDSLTHQQNYYAWVERAWRGGQRVLVNDLVTNGVICSVYSFKDRSCDEMTSIRLQAQADVRHAGLHRQDVRRHGQGLVPDRHRLRAGPRASSSRASWPSSSGVETSEPFGCKQILDIAQCSKDDIDRGLDELLRPGRAQHVPVPQVRQRPVRGPFRRGRPRYGDQRRPVPVDRHLLEDGEVHGPAARQPHRRRGGARGRGASCPAGVEVPSYDDDAQCNTRGLTELGEYAVRGMMKRKMMLEIDHMSVKAAGRALDILESESYPGVLSSHSWMDLNWTERVYGLGGFIAQYMHGAEGFSAEADRTKALREKYDVGYGYGTDMNGVGGWPAPRGADAPNPVTYPFRSTDGGSVIDKQTTGARTWDLNTDGASHYGLVPDWIEDIRLVGGQDVVDDLFRGAESYLDTWGASEGHKAGVNLAADASASASSSESNPFTSYAPGRAVDGNTDTRWASDWSDDQWLRIDLGLHEHGQACHPRLGARLREVVPRRGLHRRHHLAVRLVHHRR